MLQTKRAYEPASSKDGYRILVDRLWPRGLSKADVAADLWLKDIAPSPELRVWFGHKAERFEEFSARYVTELQNNAALAKLLAIVDSNETVTLVYAARDPTNNHACVLMKFVEEKL